MAVASGFTFIAGTTPATPSSGKSKLYVDSTSGPSYVDDAGAVHSLKGATGATGPAGSNLNSPSTTLTSSAGSAVINLASGNEIYTLTLTENTTITFSNLPASGFVSRGVVRVIQNNTTAKTCGFSGTSVKSADGATYSNTSVLNASQDVGWMVDSSGNITLYPSGVLA